MKLAPRFTLIELLVVVAIIAVLASMLLPALSKARDTAKGSLCQSKLKQHAMAQFMYRGDFDQWIPPMSDGSGAPRNSEFPYRLLEYLAVDKESYHNYNPDENMFFCPGENLRDHSGGNAVYKFSFWIGWGWGVRSTYNMNSLLGVNPAQTTIFKMRKNVNKPDMTVLYMDGAFGARTDYSYMYGKARHGGESKVNLAFNDGHVSWQLYDVLNTTYRGVPASALPFWNPDK